MIIRESIQTHTQIVPKQFEDMSVSCYGLGHSSQALLTILAKYGILNFYLVDFDNIESSNLSASFYRRDSIGNNKSYEMMNFIRDQSPIKCNMLEYRMKSNQIDINLTANINLSCVDSGNSRIEVFETVVKSINADSDFPQVFVDLRINFDEWQIFIFDLKSAEMRKQYMENLETVRDLEPEVRCGERHFINTVFDVGSVATRALISWFQNELPHDQLIFIKGNSFTRKEFWLYDLPTKRE